MHDDLGRNEVAIYINVKKIDENLDIAATWLRNAQKNICVHNFYYFPESFSVRSSL